MVELAYQRKKDEVKDKTKKRNDKSGLFIDWICFLFVLSLIELLRGRKFDEIEDKSSTKKPNSYRAYIIQNCKIKPNGSLSYCVGIIFSVLHIHQACASALVRIFNAIPSSSFSAALNCAR